MTIDVSAQRVIPLPREQVAEYAMDWRHDAEWTQGISTAELTREADAGGFGVGADVTRTAYFLGRRIDYVLRVASYDFPGLLDMVSVAGPMPMHVTYAFDPHPDGTLARIRVRGGNGGFYRLAAPLMARQVRSNLGKDLRDLERRLMGRAE
ncbi:SRPBCC family protein [Streptomyces sp. ISL-22]|uniref:SRPBCC family protein n=1 Tax=unclassified Streptomyces TaxID=2593676 RepID=UPI001BE9FD28|nr:MULTISPECIES: SRPBCC family protein [unclassified Streptomyces]MBT2421961.1 SRPBCC family protein [Streptomyces sp. ISL-24]MBT2436396.1 SRPBCC family protein [Streptomyces sp. ISL-22]